MRHRPAPLDYPYPASRFNYNSTISIVPCHKLSRNIAITMYADISQPAAALPQLQPKDVQPGVSLLAPLSRRGHGPGVILLTANSTGQLSINEGVPSASIKWAEEGFTVIEIQAAALAAGPAVLEAAVSALKECDKCDGTKKIGIVGACMQPVSMDASLTLMFSVRSRVVESDCPSPPISPSDFRGNLVCEPGP